MAVLGNNTIGASDWTTAKGMACKFTCPATAGDITEIVANIWSTGDADLRYLIYEDNAGEPGDLLATGSTGNFNTTQQWVTLAISYSFTALQVLHLAVIANDTVRIAYDAGSTNQATELLPEYNYPTPEDPANVNAQFDFNLSIYANYTPVSSTNTTNFFQFF